MVIPKKTKKTKTKKEIPSMQEEVVVSEVEAAPAPVTRVVSNEREKSDADLLDMIAGFGADKGYQLKVGRTAPKKIGAVSVEGHLDTFEEWQSEEDLREMYGGGTYQLKIFRPDGKGSMKYLKSASVKISGEPHGQGIPKKEPEVIDYGPSADEGSSQALDMVAKLVEDSRNAKQPQGMDMAAMTAMMGTFMAPLQAQIAAGQAALAETQRLASEKEARLMEIVNQKPDTSEKDGLLNKMFDTESSRSEHLRNMHDSEMRTLRENTNDDKKRSEDRHRDELRSREDIQRREIDNMTRSNETLMDTLKMSYDARIESLKADIVRVERDLSEARTELITLRAKKDKTIIEQASEFSAIKEAMDVIGGGSDKDDRSTFEKALGAMTENPDMIGTVIQAVTGGGNPAQQQQLPVPNPPPAQLEQAEHTEPEPEVTGQEVASVEDIPLNTPFRAEDGNVYVKVAPDGSIVPYETALALQKAAEEKRNPSVEPPSATEVKMAITFMESAFTAGTESKDFAASAKSMIPSNILKYIESVGVDTFLNEVAVLEQGSPLRSQAGRVYIREVAKFLLEGIPG